MVHQCWPDGSSMLVRWLISASQTARKSCPDGSVVLARDGSSVSSLAHKCCPDGSLVLARDELRDDNELISAGQVTHHCQPDGLSVLARWFVSVGQSWPVLCAVHSFNYFFIINSYSGQITCKVLKDSWC